MALIWSATGGEGGRVRRGWCGEMDEVGVGSVFHLSPCTRLARQSLEWRRVRRERGVGLERDEGGNRGGGGRWVHFLPRLDFLSAGLGVVCAPLPPLSPLRVRRLVGTRPTQPELANHTDAQTHTHTPKYLLPH